MMKFCRFVSDHQVLSVILCSAIECGAYTVILWQMSAETFWFVLGNLCLIFMNVLYVQVCANRLIYLANNDLINACDPMPLLTECERQLKKEKPGMRYQLLLIDQTAALANLGKFEEADRILNEINIDKYSGMLPAYKMVYYHNFSYVTHQLGKWDVADVYHGKAVMLYNDLRSAKQKKAYNWSIFSAEWEMHYRHGEYVRALTVLDQMQPQTLLQKVDRAWGYGSVYAAMGNSEEALKHLQYVADYPRLYTGKLAGELIAELSNANKQ